MIELLLRRSIQLQNSIDLFLLNHNQHNAEAFAEVQVSDTTTDASSNWFKN